MKILKVLIFIILLLFFIYVQNNALEITRIKYKSGMVPEGFNNYRIIHLSDLHEKEYGKGNWIMVYILKVLNPDLIVITGDLINYNHRDDENTIKFLDGIIKIAPVYYVTGNHEAAYKDFSYFEEKIKEKGIKVLHNSTDNIAINGYYFSLIGIDDPITTDMSESEFVHEYLKAELNKALNDRDESCFKILLSHRPEEFSLYAESKIDLILTGHAHGGQIRLPFIGGLYAPSQGCFPSYTSGRYIKGSSTMIVNRGTGNGTFPLRIFNRPQIIMITLLKLK